MGKQHAQRTEELAGMGLRLGALGLLAALAGCSPSDKAKTPDAPAPVAAAPVAGPDAEPRQLDRIPDEVISEITDSTKSVGSPGTTWVANQVTVAFNGGSPALYALVEQTASEWTANGGRLKLSFRKSDNSFRTWSPGDLQKQAEIRVGFFTDPARNGYWSAVGQLARRRLAGEPTMNFGDLATRLGPYLNGANAAAYKQSYSRSVILHEFGHALGLNHEHFHPQCQADMKLDTIVAFLMGPPNNWSEGQARFNMDAATFTRAMASQPGGTPLKLSPDIDKASVMLYSFPDSYFKSGLQSPCRPSPPQGYATDLSAGDKAYYQLFYAAPH